MWALNTVLWTKLTALISIQVWGKQLFFSFFNSFIQGEHQVYRNYKWSGAPGAKSTNRHSHESESDNLSTQLMRKNQLCNVLHKFNVKSQPTKFQQSINNNVIPWKGESALHVNHKEKPTPLSTTRRSSLLDLTSPALQSLHALNLWQGKGKNLVSPLTIL